MVNLVGKKTHLSLRACHRSVQNYKLEAITKQDKDIERVEKLKEIVNQIYWIVRDVTNNGGMDVGLPSTVLILEFNGLDKSKTKKKNICWKLRDSRLPYFSAFMSDMEDDIEATALWILAKSRRLSPHARSNRLRTVGGFESLVSWENHAIIQSSRLIILM